MSQPRYRLKSSKELSQEFKAKKLFECKSGAVRGVIVGPTEGFLWRKVHYYRWARSTREPGKWEQLPPDRDTDQKHLAVCVSSVNKWLEQDKR